MNAEEARKILDDCLEKHKNLLALQMAPQIGQQGHINGPRNAIMQGQKK